MLAIGALVCRSSEWGRAAAPMAYSDGAHRPPRRRFGLLAAGHFVESGSDAGAIALHRNVALVATALLVAAAPVSWRTSRPDGRATSRIASLLSTLGAVVASGAGHFGGEVLHPGMTPSSNRPHAHGAMTMPRADDYDHDAGAPASCASLRVDADATDAAFAAAADAAYDSYARRGRSRRDGTARRERVSATCTTRSQARSRPLISCECQCPS